MALIVLGISLTNEFVQLTTFLETFNLQENKYAKLVFGNTFHISDLVAYTLGVITIISLESKRSAIA